MTDKEKVAAAMTWFHENGYTSAMESPPSETFVALGDLLSEVEKLRKQVSMREPITAGFLLHLVAMSSGDHDELLELKAKTLQYLAVKINDEIRARRIRALVPIDD